MEETYYEMDLPRENIHLRCFAHSIMNYRYHWHPGSGPAFSVKCIKTFS